MSAIVEKFLSENSLVEHDARQGTPEWLEKRSHLDGSSEIAAVLGLSKKTTRDELLRLKYTGEEKHFSQWVQENILDHGHAVEALARPIIEARIGGKLYPVMQSRGRISASCDGLKAAGDVAWEHKQWNEESADLVRNNTLPEEHAPQCYQILLVTGAERLIFTISDGTPDKMESMDVYPDVAWFERIILGWAQFNKERTEYVPPVEVAKVIPDAVKALPAVVYELNGMTLTSNLETVVKPAVIELIQQYERKPETDQDFTNLKAFAENARASVIKSKAVRETVLAQVVDIDKFTRGMVELEEMLTKAAINAENLYKAENENRKNEHRAKGRDKYAAHIAALQSSIKGVTINFATPDWAAATKSLKTLKSFESAINTCLANAIIAADSLAADVRYKLSWYNQATGIENGLYGFLFADLQQIIVKPMDDFKLLVESRIQNHRQAEAAKLEAERARMAVEATAKAEREAAAKLAAEEARIRAEERDKADAEAKASMAQAIIKSVDESQPASMHERRPHKEYHDEIAAINDAITANSESVAAWEAEKLEPLRREVAMLHDTLLSIAMDVNACTKTDWTGVLEHTQATADAYEREVQAATLEKYSNLVDDMWVRGELQSKGVGNALRGMALDLRAANKGKE